MVGTLGEGVRGRPPSGKLAVCFEKQRKEPKGEASSSSPVTPVKIPDCPVPASLLEELLRPKHFLRVSKAMLLNLMKIRSIQPALNGRLSAVLQSGEEVIISRSYVKDLKSALKGG